MQKLAISLSVVLLGWLLIQVSISLLFLLYLRSPSKKSLPKDYLPKTAVIVFFSGVSPLLSDCLRSLLNQNYPEYDLKLIIDSEEDSAWSLVAHTLKEEAATNVQVSPLKMLSPHCSPKCNSLVQAVSELDDSYKVVALVDADAIVHSNWLRELVSPLAHPKVGVTTGYPWYLPTGRYWESSVRYLWNAFSVIKMHMYRIPWGGTLALKKELIHTTGLLYKWKQGYNEDTLISSVLAKHRIQIIFVPSLIILNHEECDLSSFLDWSKQQLCSYRLYHPQWWAVVTDSIFTVLLPYVMLMLSLAALWTQQWDAAVISLNSLGVYTQILLLFVITLEKRVQQILRKHHQHLPKISPTTIMKLSLVSPVTLWIYGVGMVSALRMTKTKRC